MIRSTPSHSKLSQSDTCLCDWSQVDPAALLTEVDRNTERDNQQRRQEGVSELHIKGWLQPPTLDRATATVYWAIDAIQGDTPVVNSIALRLGRNGIEKLVWITRKSDYAPLGGQLDAMLHAFSFVSGSSYADHISSDKMAEYGVAALVATVLGAKAVKAGAAAGLGAVLAKFFPVLFVPFVVARRKIVGVFKRGQKTGAALVTTKTCASCRKTIEREALTCRHCHAHCGADAPAD